jgi:hypothetical protein
MMAVEYRSTNLALDFLRIHIHKPYLAFPEAPGQPCCKARATLLADGRPALSAQPWDSTKQVEPNEFAHLEPQLNTLVDLGHNTMACRESTQHSLGPVVFIPIGCHGPFGLPQEFASSLKGSVGVFAAPLLRCP